MRLEKPMAAAVLVDTVTHDHIDVLQIHHADNIVSPERGPIFVNLKQSTIFSLNRIFDGAMPLTKSKKRVIKYHIGFLHEYGYFHKLGSPTWHDHAITYVQAYNSAAKMAHPLNSGATACYLLCRGFVRAITQDTKGRNFARASAGIKQHLYDLLAYSYVRENCTLTLKDFITLDVRRHHIPTELEELEVFVAGTTTLLTKTLLKNHLLYKMSNWCKYVELCIKRDFYILRETVYGEPSSDHVLAPYNEITRSMRAEFRLNYFVHGDNIAYGYQLMRSVFLRGTANQSATEGFVLLYEAEKDMTIDEIISRSSVAFYRINAYRLSAIFGIYSTYGVPPTIRSNT